MNSHTITHTHTYYVHTHRIIHIQICTHTHTHHSQTPHIRIQIHAYTHICTQCTYKPQHTHAHTYTHTIHTHYLYTRTGMYTHTHAHTRTLINGVVRPHLHALHFRFTAPRCLTESFGLSCSLFCILTNRWQKVWDGVEHHSCLYSDNAKWHGISPRGCPSLSSLASGASPSTVEVKSNFWKAWDSMCFWVWILF